MSGQTQQKLMNRKWTKVTLGISLVVPLASADAMSMTVAPATAVLGVTSAVYKIRERV